MRGTKDDFVIIAGDLSIPLFPFGTVQKKRENKGRKDKGMTFT